MVRTMRRGRSANVANDRRFYERLIADDALIMLPNRRPLTKQEYLADEFQSRPANYCGAVATIHDFRALVDGVIRGARCSGRPGRAG
jgi:hypothetical protein